MEEKRRKENKGINSWKEDMKQADLMVKQRKQKQFSSMQTKLLANSNSQCAISSEKMSVGYHSKRKNTETREENIN